jgi:hypothetical protein
MRGNLYTAAPRERKSAMTPALAIHHEQTCDLDGLPWPPIGDGWVLVYSAAGRTTWRRIGAFSVAGVAP